MSPDCQNDCVPPLNFPKRPNNRPGLSHIDYRIGTYSDFRETLLRNLNHDAVLAPWTHREPDDPGIALLEGAAILGDILTFYQELYANEAYLRTAQWRESVSDLVRLLGYRLSPGVGGHGLFAFEVRGDKPVTVPQGFPLTAQVTGIDGQSDFETTEEMVAYPWLSTFNLYRPFLAPNPSITLYTKEFVVTAPDPFTNPVLIEEGDRILIGDGSPAGSPTRLLNPEVVVIESVRELHGQKIYRINGGLSRSGSVPQLAGLKLGRAFRHFGHNSPLTFVQVSGTSATTKYVLFSRSVAVDTSAYVGTLSDRILDPSPLGGLVMPLDSEVNDLPRGIVLVIQGTFDNGTGSTLNATLLRRITNLSAGSMTWGLVSGATTFVTLNDFLSIQQGNTTYGLTDIRTLQFHETDSQLLYLQAAPVETTAASGHTVNFLGTDAQAQALKGRTLLLAKNGETPQKAVVQSVQSLPAAQADQRRLRQVTVDLDLTYADFPNQDPVVTAYGNIVEATQGKTEREAALGNGDSRESFQTFKLPKAPLTYLLSDDETPPEVPELDIYVNDRLWTRAPSFFGHGPKEEIYIVREDANGESWVQFGDGKTGARLPSGIKNVVARYRTGIGAYGPLVTDTKVNPGGRVDRLNKVYLPGEVSGGDQPEDGEKAREAAPGKVQSLDRLVSLRDFEMETLAIPGVSRVSAAWELVDNVPGVVIIVLMETGREDEIAQVQELLNGYNRSRGPQRFPVTVKKGCLKYIYLDISVAIDPTYRQELVLEAAKEALGVVGEEGNGVDGSKGLMAVLQRRFGEREYATRIEGVVQNVEGVLWTKVNGLGPMPVASFTTSGSSGTNGCVPSNPLALTPPSTPWTRNEVVACDPDQILALHVLHLQISAVSLPGEGS